MVNNFDLINNFLRFEEDGSQFYFLQIIRRKKENPDTKSSYVIKSFYIRSNDHLNNLKEEIVLLCKTFNARAYINLNVKSYKKINYQLIKKLADNLTFGSEHGVVSALDSVCGETGSDGDKYWLIDVDTKDYDTLALYIKEISKCHSNYPIPETNVYDNIVLEVPTLNGYHLITRPFNIKQLEPFLCTLMPVDIHKNNPTILYYENPSRYKESDGTK